MAKTAGNEFPAPWLNGRPINAPNKINMINWYSQTNGYYADATEHDSKNSVLRFFRSQGSILYDDEFHSKNTVNHDDSQTSGRVARVFRAIDMISKYKAAHEDGADLSKSIIRDFDIIWYDHEQNVIPHQLMHNLRRVEGELRNRSPENSPVRAFWMGQEIQRTKWASAGPNTDRVDQDHPTATDNPTSPIATVYYYDHNPGRLSYVPINQEHGFTDPVMAVTAHYPQNQAQQSSGWFDREITPANISSQDHQQPLTVLNPTTAVFVPSHPNISPPALTQEPSMPGPINSSGQPITQKADLTVAELIAQGQKAYNWQVRDDEYWPGDHIFIPTFCRPIQSWATPQLLGPGYVAPKPDSDNQSKRTPGSNTNQEPNKENVDSGYASGSPPLASNGVTAATNGNSGNDADDEISEYEGSQSEDGSASEHEERGVDVEYPGAYELLRIRLEARDARDGLGGSRSSVLIWLAGAGGDGWTWEGRMRQ